MREYTYVETNTWEVYQRLDASLAEFLWVACDVLTVGHEGDGCCFSLD